jgi:hypothetical protein
MGILPAPPTKSFKGACEWGFDEDRVRAIAKEESYWWQLAAGDFTYDTSLCPSGAIIAVPGATDPANCPDISIDFGGLSPNSTKSTALVVNYKLAYQHACLDGKISYPSNQNSDYTNSDTYDMLLRPINQWLPDFGGRNATIITAQMSRALFRVSLG